MTYLYTWPRCVLPTPSQPGQLILTHIPSSLGTCVLLTRHGCLLPNTSQPWQLCLSNLVVLSESQIAWTFVSKRILSQLGCLLTTWTEDFLLNPSQQRKLGPTEFQANPSRHDLPIYLAQVRLTDSQPTWAVDSYRHPMQPGQACLINPAGDCPTESCQSGQMCSLEQAGVSIPFPTSLGRGRCVLSTWH